MNTKNIKKKDYLGAAIFVVICEVAGGAGALFTTPQIGTWYAGLNKPMIAPPNWIFAPVWTTLFALMGVAAYLVWRRRKQDVRAGEALMIFFMQLGLNIIWSGLFFGRHSVDGALAEIIVLWLAILLTIVKFKSISRTAAYLLLPYILWVTFAGYLNFLLYTLN